MKYKTIIFDLGGVLINLNPMASFQSLQEKVPSIDLSTFNGKEAQLSFYSDFEMGKIDSSRLLQQFNTHHHSHLTLSEFTDAWNAMILDFPIAKIELVRKLRNQGTRVLLLSNINEIHEKKVDERFTELNQGGRFRDLFDHAYYSHLIGKRKPNPDIFEWVLNENGLDPHETLFIDDSAQHIRAAQALGIACIHLISPNELIGLEPFEGLLR